MAISKFDVPAQYVAIDTYDPLPFQEMAMGLLAKQKKLDNQVAKPLGEVTDLVGKIRPMPGKDEENLREVEDKLNEFSTKWAKPVDWGDPMVISQYNTELNEIKSSHNLRTMKQSGTHYWDKYLPNMANSGFSPEGVNSFTAGHNSDEGVWSGTPEKFVSQKDRYNDVFANQSHVWGNNGTAWHTGVQPGHITDTVDNYTNDPAGKQHLTQRGIDILRDKGEFNNTMDPVEFEQQALELGRQDMINYGMSQLKDNYSTRSSSSTIQNIEATEPAPPSFLETTMLDGQFNQETGMFVPASKTISEANTIIALGLADKPLAKDANANDIPNTYNVSTQNSIILSPTMVSPADFAKTIESLSNAQHLSLIYGDRLLYTTVMEKKDEYDAEMKRAEDIDDYHGRLETDETSLAKFTKEMYSVAVIQAAAKFGFTGKGPENINAAYAFIKEKIPQLNLRIKNSSKVLSDLTGAKLDEIDEAYVNKKITELQTNVENNELGEALSEGLKTVKMTIASNNDKLIINTVGADDNGAIYTSPIPYIKTHITVTKNELTALLTQAKKKNPNTKATIEKWIDSGVVVKNGDNYVISTYNSVGRANADRLAQNAAYSKSLNLKVNTAQTLDQLYAYDPRAAARIDINLNPTPYSGHYIRGSNASYASVRKMVKEETAAIIELYN
jgi:hypothetical protein